MADQASELVARIVENLGSSALNEFNWISGVNEELQRIKETLLVINVVLLDAQEHQSTSKSTRHWLQNLKSVAYDIEDVLDLISTQNLELKVNGRSLFRKITKLFTNYEVAQELRVIRHKLDEIECNRRSYNFEEQNVIPLHVGTTVQRESYSYVHGSDVIGRKEDKERIISLISSSSCDFEGLSVIPVIGIGGMGKSTLASLVFNDPSIVARFDLRLWAHVSNKFALKTLIANILQTSTGLDFSHLNMESLQMILREKLEGQSYLLILDDVCIRDPRQWIELKELLDVGSPRSTVIVTTREERVTRITGTMEPYRLKGLSIDHCWSIFARCAFNRGEEDFFPLLVKIGKSIVQKCQGVPLAAKTLGSVLYGERDYHTWKRIEESDLWKIEQGTNDILPALKLSYDQTPYHLRSCFASCAFKKGYPLFRTHLINMWLALGILQPRGGEDVEDIGNGYIKELVSRSFFKYPGYVVTKNVIAQFGEVFDEWKLNNIAQMFKKDKINERSESISEDVFLIDDKVFFVEMHDLLHDLAAYVSKEDTVIMSSNKKAISPSVRYIMWDHGDLSRKEFPVHLLEGSKARSFQFVQPLGLVSKSFLTGLISNLKCLRILNLHHFEFEKLPDSIGDLKHLRYLNLSFNSRLIMLPHSTCKLVNLQSLDLFRCIELETLPKDVHKLIRLRYLILSSKAICLSDGGLYRLSSLQNLKFWYCQNLTSLSEGIGNLKSLCVLMIIGCPKITSLPNGIIYLTNLKELRIIDCRNLDLKGWEGLYGLRSLKYLDLRALPKMLIFPDGLESASGSLQYFNVDRCCSLMTMPKRLQHYTCLLSLRLIGCPNLTALPRDMHATRSLQLLVIDGCLEISRRCEKDIGSDWHLISHIPEIRINLQIIQKKAPSPHMS